MPIVKTVEGNLLKKFKQNEFSAIAHGCNCFHLMRAGIAGQISHEFPQAELADMKTSYGYNLKLGQYSEADTDHGKIFNLYTQFRPGGENPKVLASSIALAFQTLDIRHGGRPDFLVGIPLIGCGIAGGDWDHIKNVIDTFTPKLLICVVEYKP